HELSVRRNAAREVSNVIKIAPCVSFERDELAVAGYKGKSVVQLRRHALIGIGKVRRLFLTEERSAAQVEPQLSHQNFALGNIGVRHDRNGEGNHLTDV